MGHGYLKKAHTGNGVLWALTDGHDFNHFDSFLCIFPFFSHLTYSLWFVLPWLFQWVEIYIPSLLFLSTTLMLVFFFFSFFHFPILHIPPFSLFFFWPWVYTYNVWSIPHSYTNKGRNFLLICFLWWGIFGRIAFIPIQSFTLFPLPYFNCRGSEMYTLYTYGTRDTLHYALHGTLEEKRKRTLVDYKKKGLDTWTWALKTPPNYMHACIASNCRRLEEEEPKKRT